MSKFSPISLALALSAAFVLPAAAQSSPVPSSANKIAPATSATATKHTLMGTFLDGKNVNTVIPSGFTTIDTLIVPCTNATGCTIEIKSMVQTSDSSAGAWAICPKVDGNFLSNPGCPYQQKSVGGYYVVGYEAAYGSVAKGNHTVELQVYSSTATATVSNIEINVAVYKP